MRTIMFSFGWLSGALCISGIIEAPGGLPAGVFAAGGLVALLAAAVSSQVSP